MKPYRKAKRRGVIFMQQNKRNRKEKEDPKKENPTLSKVIERNIRTIIHLRTKAARK